MEIGAGAIIILIGLGVLWVECTKTGERFINWFGKNLCDIDVNDLED